MKKIPPSQSWLYAFVIFSGVAGTCYSQSVGINTATPDSSAVFDISSTTKGVLITRLSTTQRNGIAAACSCTLADGLMIYNTTTKCFEAYIDGAWSTLS